MNTLLPTLCIREFSLTHNFFTKLLHVELVALLWIVQGSSYLSWQSWETNDEHLELPGEGISWVQVRRERLEKKYENFMQTSGSFVHYISWSDRIINKQGATGHLQVCLTVLGLLQLTRRLHAKCQPTRFEFLNVSNSLWPWHDTDSGHRWTKTSPSTCIYWEIWCHMSTSVGSKVSWVQLQMKSFMNLGFCGHLHANLAAGRIGTGGV